MYTKAPTPISYVLAEALLEVTVEGQFTEEEELAGFEQALAAIPYGQKPGVVIDVTGSAEFRGFSSLRRLAELLGRDTALLGGRVGIVVPNRVRFGIARPFAALLLGRGLEGAAFRDRPGTGVPV